MSGEPLLWSDGLFRSPTAPEAEVAATPNVVTDQERSEALAAVLADLAVEGVIVDDTRPNQ